MNTPFGNCERPESEICFDETFKLIGDFWNLRIIDVIGDHDLRFGEIERKLVSCNPVTLTSRLKRLEEAGVVIRHTETRDKQSVCYSLSEKGTAILPILHSIKDFNTRFHPGREQA